MNVLVTGIDGFVGSHLAEALLSTPDLQLFGTVLSQPGRLLPEGLKSKISFLNVDITRFDEVREAIFAVKPAKIFHLAGQAFVPMSLDDPMATFRANVDGTIHLLEATREYSKIDRQPCSVLVVSSGEVYGEVQAGAQPIQESEPLNPANPYATSKACADLIAQQYRSAFAVDSVVARPFNHLGPRQSELFVGSAVAKQIAEIKLGKREPRLMVGNLEPERDFTDVRDVVRAYIAILNHPRKRSVYNVCSGRAVTIKKIVNLLIEIASVGVEIVPDPSRQRRNEIPKIVGSASLLSKDTGWSARIPLEQTLTDLLNYWEERVLAGQ